MGRGLHNLLALSSRFPETLRDLITYQLFIVKHSKRFKYPSWLFYDVEYRKWAAANNIRNWSITNSELYSLAFTGQALAINWCPVCQVEGGNHTYDCPQACSQLPMPMPRPQQAGALPQRRVAPYPVDTPAKRPAPTPVYFLTRMGDPAHMVCPASTSTYAHTALAHTQCSHAPLSQLAESRLIAH